MAIRLIATDLDGTFMGGSSEVLPENAASFREAVAAGIPVCICSGRTPADIAWVRRRIGTEAWIIGYNGGVIRTPDDRDIFLQPLKKEALLPVLPFVEATGFLYHLCTLDGRYVIAPESMQERAERSAASMRSRDVHAEIVRSWTQVPEGDLDACYKLIVTGSSPEDGEYLRRETPRQGFDVTVTSSGVSNIEIVPPGIDKGMAIRRLCEELGISTQDVMAFGDQKNDLAMLTAVGWPVVMGNGDEETKKVARIIAPPNTENGVAQIVRRVVLGKE